MGAPNVSGINAGPQAAGPSNVVPVLYDTTLNQVIAGGQPVTTSQFPLVTNTVTNPRQLWDKLRHGYEISRFNNPHVNTVMASAPTATLFSALPQDATKTYTYATNPNAFYATGGSPQNTGSGGSYVFAVASTTSGGNCGSDTAHQENAWRVKMLIDAVAPVFRVLANTSAYRFIVNGQYVNTTGVVASNGGLSNYIKLDFTSVGGRATREVWIESAGGSMAFVSVSVRGGETVNAAPTGLRMTYLGDSICAGTIGGGGNQADGFGMVMSECFGIGDARCSGLGGQGVQNVDNLGNTWNLPARLTPTINPNAFVIDAPPSDVFVFCMGTNDVSYTYASNVTAYTNCLQKLLTQYPNTPIIVIGCPGNNAGPAETNTNCDLAIAAAVAAVNSPLLLYIPSATHQPYSILNGTGNTTAATSGTATMTGALTAATSATLTANFTGPTGLYDVSFDTPIVKPTTLTNGSATFSWSGNVTTTTATIYYYGQNYPLTLTAAPGPTSATLSAGFPGSTGTFLITFSSGEVRSVALTNNGTALAWTDALLLAATTSVVAQAANAVPGNCDLYYNAGDATHMSTAGHLYAGLTYADLIYGALKGL